MQLKVELSTSRSKLQIRANSSALTLANKAKRMSAVGKPMHVICN